MVGGSVNLAVVDQTTEDGVLLLGKLRAAEVSTAVRTREPSSAGSRKKQVGIRAEEEHFLPWRNPGQVREMSATIGALEQTDCGSGIQRRRFEGERQDLLVGDVCRPEPGR